jgi:hypothetical protein
MPTPRHSQALLPPHPLAPAPARRRAGRAAGWVRAGRAALPVLALAAGLLALAGCTLEPTPYQPLGDAGGYEESQLGPQLFRVSFRGNRATPETTVLDFALLRCAELTHQHGFTHFVIEQDFGRTQLALRPGPGSSVGVGMGFGTGRSFWSMGFGAPLSEPDYEAVVSYHLAVFVVRLLSDAEATQIVADSHGQTQVYDADFLLKSLAAKRAASQHPGK